MRPAGIGGILYLRKDQLTLDRNKIEIISVCVWGGRVGAYATVESGDEPWLPEGQKNKGNLKKEEDVFFLFFLRRREIRTCVATATLEDPTISV